MTSIPSGYTKRITITQGDDYDATYTYSSIPPGQGIQKAWFTVKTDVSVADASATIQKAVTADIVAGRGQVVDTGATSHHATVFFEVPAAETAALTIGQAYLFDVQFQSSAGKRITFERGVVSVVAQTTQS